MPRRFKLLAIIAPIVLLLDQATKIWARAALPVNDNGYGVPVTVIENYWDWLLAQNTGSAFSFLAGTSGSRIILSVISLIAVCLVIYLIKQSRDDQTSLIAAFSLMIGGAVGNLIDRVFLGSVTDFVHWHYYDKSWPIFNVADIALVFAAGLFIWHSIRDWKEQKAGARSAGSTPLEPAD